MRFPRAVTGHREHLTSVGINMHLLTPINSMRSTVSDPHIQYFRCRRSASAFWAGFSGPLRFRMALQPFFGTLTNPAVLLRLLNKYIYFRTEVQDTNACLD